MPLLETSCRASKGGHIGTLREEMKKKLDCLTRGCMAIERERVCSMSWFVIDVRSREPKHQWRRIIFFGI